MSCIRDVRNIGIQIVNQYNKYLDMVFIKVADRPLEPRRLIISAWILSHLGTDYSSRNGTLEGKITKSGISL